MENSAMKMDLFFANGSKAGIQLERSTIGSGADARIYRIVDYPELAAKVYHDPDKDPSRADKVRAMMDAPPDLPTIQEKGTTYCQIAWPVGRLTNPHGKFVGYAMLFVDLKQSTVQEGVILIGFYKAPRSGNSAGPRIKVTARIKCPGSL